MDFGALAKSVWEQFVTVWHTPVPFLAALIASWFVMRWFIRGHYEVRLANDQSTIEMLEKRLDRQQSEEAIAIATSATTIAKTVTARPPVLPHKPGGITIRDVTNVFKEHTEFQSKKLIEPMLGRVLAVSGPVRDVSVRERKDAPPQIVVSLYPDEEGLIICAFNGRDPDLEDLNKEEVISVEGVLESATALWVELTGCRML